MLLIPWENHSFYSVYNVSEHIIPHKTIQWYHLLSDQTKQNYNFFVENPMYILLKKGLLFFPLKTHNTPNRQIYTGHSTFHEMHTYTTPYTTKLKRTSSKLTHHTKLKYTIPNHNTSHQIGANSIQIKNTTLIMNSTRQNKLHAKRECKVVSHNTNKWNYTRLG